MLIHDGTRGGIQVVQRTIGKANADKFYGEEIRTLLTSNHDIGS